MQEERFTVRLDDETKQILDRLPSRQKSNFIRNAILHYFRYGKTDEVKDLQEQAILSELKNISSSLAYLPKIADLLQQDNSVKTPPVKEVQNKSTDKVTDDESKEDYSNFIDDNLEML